MEYGTISYVKDLFDRLCSYCDVIDSENLWNRPEGFDIPLRDVFKVEAARYILYLSSSDKFIDKKEVELYHIITGYGDTADALIRFIKENNIYSEQYADSIPSIIKISTDCDSKALAAGCRFKPSESIGISFAKFFRVLGELLISIDGSVSYTEKSDFDKYNAKLDSYINKKSVSVTEFYDYICKLDSMLE